MSISTTRDKVIQNGLSFLDKLESEQICKVCIRNGGSCCTGCTNLQDGVGCQLRNTSCTAWLCGFLKYILYEAQLLEEWESFWEQVPGMDYRKDNTPSSFSIRKSLNSTNIQLLGKAFAQDLAELTLKHTEADYVLTLREIMDSHLRQIRNKKNNPVAIARSRRNLKMLTSRFVHFQEALEQYRMDDYY